MLDTNPYTEIAVVLEEQRAVQVAHYCCLAATGTQYLQRVRKTMLKNCRHHPSNKQRFLTLISHLHLPFSCSCISDKSTFILTAPEEFPSLIPHSSSTKESKAAIIPCKQAGNLMHWNTRTKKWKGNKRRHHKSLSSSWQMQQSFISNAE